MSPWLRRIQRRPVFSATGNAIPLFSTGNRKKHRARTELRAGAEGQLPHREGGLVTQEAVGNVARASACNQEEEKTDEQEWGKMVRGKEAGRS